MLETKEDKTKGDFFKIRARQDCISDHELAASFSRNLSLPAPPALQAQASEQEDPFYRKLYDEGKYFYENKNYAGAIEDFGVAFFGKLYKTPPK